MAGFCCEVASEREDEKWVLLSIGGRTPSSLCGPWLGHSLGLFLENSLNLRIATNSTVLKALGAGRFFISRFTERDCEVISARSVSQSSDNGSGKFFSFLYSLYKSATLSLRAV